MRMKSRCFWVFVSMIAAAVVSVSMPRGEAAITFQYAPAPNFLDATGTLPGTARNIAPELAAAGWSAWMLTLKADNSSRITTVELANDLQGKGGTIGITGSIHQAWVNDLDSGKLIATPTGSQIGPSESLPTRWGSGGGRDSYWLSSGYYDIATLNLSEDNNLQHGSNPPFTRSPLTDDMYLSIPRDYGVGSRMSFLGASSQAVFGGTLNLAYVIFPFGGPGEIRGYALDQNNSAYFFDAVVGFIPEPATLFTVAGGGLLLIGRRRGGR